MTPDLTRSLTARLVHHVPLAVTAPATGSAWQWKHHRIHDGRRLELPDRIPAPSQIHRMGLGAGRGCEGRVFLGAAGEQFSQHSFAQALPPECFVDVKLNDRELAGTENVLGRSGAVCPPSSGGKRVAEAKAGEDISHAGGHKFKASFLCLALCPGNETGAAEHWVCFAGVFGMNLIIKVREGAEPGEHLRAGMPF